MFCSTIFYYAKRVKRTIKLTRYFETSIVFKSRQHVYDVEVKLYACTTNTYLIFDRTLGFLLRLE